MASLGKDISPEFIAKYAVTATNATAGGAGDNTEVDGATLDTMALPCHAQSVSFVIGARATLAQTKTLTVTANLQDSADGSQWADITDPAAILVLTGATGGSTETGTAKIGYDLTKARRYVRIQATPDLNATGTDTATIFGTAIFGGLQILPQ